MRIFIFACLGEHVGASVGAYSSRNRAHRCVAIGTWQVLMRMRAHPLVLASVRLLRCAGVC